MEISQDILALQANRRAFLSGSAFGLGSIALSTLMATSKALGAEAPVSTHFGAKAKRVIFVYLIGGPSQVDLFDPKDELRRLDGQKIPESILATSKFPFISGTPNLMGSPYKFARHGQSAAHFSELLPQFASVADDLAIVRSMQTEEVGHAAAELFFHTGFARLGRPSFGCWTAYGLGTENQNLPSYVVLSGQPTYAGSNTWGAGFLPSRHQGVKFRSGQEPIFYLRNPEGIDADDQGSVVDAVNRLNRHQATQVGDPEIETRVSQYEMAFRMQSSVPDLMNLKTESPSTLDQYGAKAEEPSFAANCLIARRLSERGVRFVQVCSNNWDHHEDIYTALPRACQQVDRPLAALIRDLKQRGMLDETLVIISGEFGRSPVVQDTAPNGRKGRPGRDHHKDAFTTILCGGGAKPGVTYGATDDLGMKPVENPVHVHDLHATALHLLGIDHKRLTYRYQGRNFRLTDVHGRVVQEILA
ncbi:MAG: DUF1501 domain-containing protein [Bryobacteraceae bacterium]|nr:DUF1501 domain-containing protein [Bryobacteraceae bacterium]